MPELAEVEHSRRQWNPGLGEAIREVFITRPSLRIFRDTDTQMLFQLLPGQKLIKSEARGKQMLFQFTAVLNVIERWGSGRMGGDEGLFSGFA